MERILNFLDKATNVMGYNSKKSEDENKIFYSNNSKILVRNCIHNACGTFLVVAATSMQEKYLTNHTSDGGAEDI